MKHFGDITKINGAEVPIVDIICGGSPCQDLSVAGKRAGLSGERSGLFMEQIRIIKEMRENDERNGRAAHLCRPRFCVWENVPGAFSSNGGKDFQAVLTEFSRVAAPDAPDVPMPKDGKWAKCGCLYDELGRWSIAWRVHDAQFWGVPQRRKRIALVADFGGLAAPEILFERKGLSWHPEPGRTEREEAAGTVGGGVESASGFTNRGYESGSVAETLRSDPHGAYPMVTQNTERTGALSTLNNQSVFCLQGNGIDRADTAGCNGRGWKENVSYTLNTIDSPAVCAGFKAGNGAKASGIGYEDEMSPTLAASPSGMNQVPTVVLNDQGGARWT